MQLLLTDRLTCPRCGPEFGLILLADRLVDRRVHEGTLGCPNCRDSFTVREGFADLRAPPRGELEAGLAGAAPVLAKAAGSDGPRPPDEAERLVALLGIQRGPGTVALAGGPARFAHFVADSIEEIQVVAVDADTSDWPEHAAVSRVAAAPGLPFFSRMLRGAVVDGRLGRGLLVEGARVVAPRSRIVVTSAPEGTPEVLEEAGLSVLAAESGTVVAARA